MGRLDRRVGKQDREAGWGGRVGGLVCREESLGDKRED